MSCQFFQARFDAIDEATISRLGAFDFIQGSQITLKGVQRLANRVKKEFVVFFKLSGSPGPEHLPKQIGDQRTLHHERFLLLAQTQTSDCIDMQFEEK